jgi:hypothetical protein
VTLADFGYLFWSFGFFAPKDFLFILALSVHDEAYS